jgi:hypothetical protein
MILRFPLAATLLGALLLTACQTEQPKKHNVEGLFDEPVPPTSISMPKADDSSNDLTDPCFVNMENIVTSLLVYYGKHNALPDTLADLPAKALTGETLSFVCPVNKLDYAYFSQGLRAKNVMDLLVLYDPLPVHNGIRHAVVMEPPVPNHAVNMYIIPLKQDLLDYYLMSAQPVRQRPFAQPQQ